MDRLNRSNRLMLVGDTLRYIRYLNDFQVFPVSNVWEDTVISGFGVDKIYVVFTLPKVIERCILMASDPGDLVLDPTCGSGTTAYVAEQWGRRWITIDTSRVALALARTRLMAARYRFGIGFEKVIMNLPPGLGFPVQGALAHVVRPLASTQR